MIIGINASDLTSPHPTGVQRYTEQIILKLLEHPEHQFRLYTPQQLPAPFGQNQVLIKGTRYWTQIHLPIELWKHRPDVFFQPSYMLPPYRFCPEVTTIHDLAWIKFPDSYSGSQLSSQKITARRIIQHQAQVIVPSQSTLNDCQELLNLAPDHLHLIPEALIPLPPPEATLPAKIARLQGRQIILVVGRLERRKNLVPLIETMEVIIRRQAWIDHNQSKPPILVLIGQPGFMAGDVFAAITRARDAGAEIEHVADANDQQLADWLSIASVLVYPSLYEGFGLPILQAFSFSLPVIASRNSSIPEVAGEAAEYLDDPASPDRITLVINSLLYNSDMRKIMVEKSKKQLDRFSWDKAAEQTLSVLANAKI